MSDTNPKSSSASSSGQSLPAVPEDRQTPSAVPSAAAQAKKVQSSIGACDACRLRKVRCLANESSMSSKCQRCSRANRECVYTTHSKTRRRKRTDTRVKELEEKVRGLSMLLESKNANSKQSSVERDVIESTEPDVEEAARNRDEFPSTGGYGGVSEEGFSPLGQPIPHQPKEDIETTLKRYGQGSKAFHSQRKDLDDPSPVFPDVIDRGIITMEKATELVRRYIDDLLPVYPAVSLPSECTAASLRESKPIMFLAVLAASAGASSPALNLRLNKEIQQVYATKVSMQGRKSLEMVQAMLISILWIYPPDKFEDLKFHQQVSMAATMALDLGLAQKHRPSTSHSRSRDLYDTQYSSPSSQSEGTPQPGMSPGARRLPENATLESRRTLLACYVFTASVSMSLRLPNMLRFSSWMTEALEELEKSPFSAPTDKRFVAWVKLQRIVEECGSALALDDPYEANTSLADKRVQAMLGGCEKQLEAWRANNADVMNAFLEINYHANNLYLHEIALHPDHDIDDFRPPFFIAVKLPSTHPSTTLTPPYVNAIIQCITSADALITTFLGMSAEEILQCPTLVFVRVVYASVVLIKISMSANLPSSDLGNLIAPESNKIDTYLQQLLVHLRSVPTFENGSRHVLSSKFLGILTKLKFWYERQKQQTPAELLSSIENGQDKSQNGSIFFPPPVQETQNLQFDPDLGSVPWSQPPQTNSLSTSQFAMPSFDKNSIFNNFAKGPAGPPVDRSATQTIQSTSWPATFQTPAGGFPGQANMPLNLPMETDPNLFTHLVNAELDHSQDNWMPEADPLNGMDFSTLPDFNWAWPQPL